ncbi:SH3 domain-containing protein [Streptomyces incarnatus]|uniref:SH3 domain-containing protein n=1 Tax=Streptomyces sp. HF10 TaxID=2692233 RepID=UPI00119CD65E|nr:MULTISPECIES: SH3 domain-containing protein [Streptomyces]QHC27982.1 SH3 domain-containing protein [Streptomyces sp. HF10]
MIRRALKSVLPAAAAALALLPVSAGAAAASSVTAHPVAAVATAQHPVQTYPHHTGLIATGGVRLNVRSGPGTGYRVVGSRHTDRLISVSCKTYGSRVRGNHVWYRLPQHRGYVSAHYVTTHRYVPWC